jgi:hypothetical protein
MRKILPFFELEARVKNSLGYSLFAAASCAARPVKLSAGVFMQLAEQLAGLASRPSWQAFLASLAGKPC